jgi:aspartate-semialdehyde dehydrogenase
LLLASICFSKDDIVKPVRLALVGATGLVGRTTLDILTEWQIPIEHLRLFASDGSAGKEMTWQGRRLLMERIDQIPQDVDAAIFATSKTVSREWAPRYRDAGIIVIDHSAEFRMHPDVPLVIPEVNGADLRAHHGLLANPNCSASVVVIPLAVVDRAFGIITAVIDTYQSVSGSGQDGLAELETQLVDPAAGRNYYPRIIAHNIIPQIGPFDADGQSDEERKVGEEVQKMLNHRDLHVLTTTVRVPVRVGHSAAVTLACKRDVDIEVLEHAFRKMRGMIYTNDTYHTPLEIAGRQEVFVSRLRLSPVNQHWLQFWVTGDNLRKGAASNAVQILMEIFQQ